MTKTKQIGPETEFYTKWLGIFDTKLMCLKNNRNEYLMDKIDEQILNYLNNNSIDKDWKNQLLLIVLVDAARNLDIQTTLDVIRKLNVRFKDIFDGYGIELFLNFDTGIHLYGYLKGEICPDSTNRKKSYLLSYYKTRAYFTEKWTKNNLSLDEQLYFKQFILPAFRI